jgi:hypothetical protein
MKILTKCYHSTTEPNHTDHIIPMKTNNIILLIALLALMALTRTEYPGISFIIPDASWAVFMLAGFFLSKPLFFAIFALTAWGIDLYAFRTDLAAAYCLTPGYASLVLTWMALWFGGWLVNAQMKNAVLRLTLITLPTVIVAFVLSNMGYYLFSSYGETMTLAAYSQAVLKYLPMYLASTAAYVALVGSLATALNSLTVHRASQQA